MLLRDFQLNLLATPSRSAPVPPLMTARSMAVFLLMGDLCGISLFLVLNYFLRAEEALDAFSLSLSGTIVLILLSLYVTDAYRPDVRVSGLGAPTRTIASCLFAGATIAALSYVLRGNTLTPLLLRSILLPGLALFTVWAVILRFCASAWILAHAKQSACLMIGSDQTTQQFEQDFRKWNPLGKLVVLGDRTETASHSTSTHIAPTGGGLNDLSMWIQQQWSGVVVAPQHTLSNQQLQCLMQLRLQGTPVYNLPNFYELLWQKLPPAVLKDTWFTFGGGFHLFADRTSLKIKRLVDIATASLLLIMVSPLMALTALAIKLESPGPVFYSQLRNGLHGQAFRVYKFRSMRQDAEKMGAQWAQKRDPRITRVGYVLRLMRIDELPQLWNVLRGEMSLIGPRPERPEFDSKLAEQIPYYNMRYLVKPGITGWAQVMYPYGASVEDAYEKLSYDLYYIKNYSIWLDLAIAFKTVRIVVLGKGQ